jgi:hypothetical protein
MVNGVNYAHERQVEHVILTAYHHEGVAPPPRLGMHICAAAVW